MIQVVMQLAAFCPATICRDVDGCPEMHFNWDGPLKRQKKRASEEEEEDLGDGVHRLAARSAASNPAAERRS